MNEPKFEQCPCCHGEGDILISSNGFREQCPICFGTGRRDYTKPIVAERSRLDIDDDSTVYRLKAWLLEHPACLCCGQSTDISALCPACGRGIVEDVERRTAQLWAMANEKTV